MSSIPLLSSSGPPSSPLSLNHVPPVPRNLFSLKRSPDELGPPKKAPTRISITKTYKLNYDIETQSYILIWQESHYRLTKIKDDSGESFSHLVWKAQENDQFFIAKLYEQKSPQSKKAAAQADLRCLTNTQEFLNSHPIEGVRLAKRLSNPITDGFLMMEFVEGSSNYATWKDKTTLDESETKILIKATTIIETMWSKKWEGVVDFRIENVLLTPTDELVIIDCCGDLDPLNLPNHLNAYITNWAQNNPAALALLTANLQDLVEQKNPE